jgi:ubiquinol-cytochrome c reductase cytochrome b subunit
MRAFPATETYEYHMSKYYAPKNFNFWYFFGVLSMVVLVNQLATGIWLTMFYTPDRPLRMTQSLVTSCTTLSTAGCCAICTPPAPRHSLWWCICTCSAGCLYGSYRKPRELLWIFGMLIYLCLMAEGFFGYVLPWGNMSYWGAQVIVNLAGAVPFVVAELVEWVRGDYLISGATLNRFFACT